MKFLNSDGLKVVLSKIKELFYTKTEVDEKLKSVSGGGTEVSEFYVKLIDARYQKTFFFNFKIIEGADLVHFYVKAIPLDRVTSYKTNDAIKCINEYIFKNIVRRDEYKNLVVYQFSINSQGLKLKERSSDRYYIEPEQGNFWIYLGGVPTSEIRK